MDCGQVGRRCGGSNLPENAPLPEECTYTTYAVQGIARLLDPRKAILKLYYSWGWQAIPFRHWLRPARTLTEAVSKRIALISLSDMGDGN
jgi:hypothetical protein